MVERDVTLANGTTERVLAPQVYLSRLHEADLKPSGALIAANVIDINDSVNNSGTIRANTALSINAKDITNRAGTISSGGSAALVAGNDILNLSGKISGESINLTAGRDIRNERTSKEVTHTVSDNPQTRSGFGFANMAQAPTTAAIKDTELGLEAGINATRTLSLHAERDITIIGAAIDAGADAMVNAGRDLTVGVLTATNTTTADRNAVYQNTVTQLTSSVKTEGNLTLVSGNDMHLTSATLDVGTLRQAQGDRGNLTMVAGGDLTFDASKNSTSLRYNTGSSTGRFNDETVLGSTLNAGNNITLAATQLNTDGTTQTGGANASAGRTDGKGNITLQSTGITSADGKLTVAADANVTLTATEENHDSYTESHASGSGLFTHTTLDVRDRSQQIAAVGSTLSAEGIDITSGRDLTVSGSSIAGTRDVNLDAGADLTIAAASGSYNQSHYNHTQESGLMSGGGIGITIGSREQTDQYAADGSVQSQYRSLVGSTNGNLGITAGANAKVSGSDLIAANNIDLTAQNITLDTGLDREHSSESHDFKQSGLTLALTSPVVTAVQTAQQMKQAAGQTRDRRLQALAGISAGLAGYDAYNQVKAGQAVENGNLADQAGGINVSISIGNSSSHSDTTRASEQHFGSSLAAGHDVNLSATGAGTLRQAQGDRSDITIQGSSVTAGNNTALTADHAINLLAAQNTASQTSTNRSSSNSLGVGFALGGQSNGFTLNLAASRARGNADGSDVNWNNTHVNANNQLTLQSGGDTTLKGAVATGKQITADIGGNLAIESLQDRSTYTSKQSSAGVGLNLCIPPFCYGASSASVSASKSKANSNYASVIEQSGIKAGDNGFDIAVAGNTDLKGVVISSTALPSTSGGGAGGEGTNTLVTSTLTQSDLQNKADASASSSGFNLSSDMLTQGKYGVTKGVIGNALNNGEASGSSAGQTRSAVSEGAVTITDEAGQQQRTGKTGQETIASLNRDTANAHTAAQKQDVEAMQRTVEAERAIKQAVVAEAVKFSDEAYRKIFIEKHPMYEVVKDKDENTQFDATTGKPLLRELSDQEKTNLQAGSDGKIHISTNGIFNDKDAAGIYANQHSNTSGPQYVIYFPEANNVVSELMVAGYQKFLENDFMGLSNSTEQVKNSMNQYGQSGLQLDGHSRGAMTIGNALESQANTPNATGSLSRTTINFFGPAYNAQQADDLLSTLQDRSNLPEEQQSGAILQFQNHAADPVGGLVGRNSSTGGTIPEGSSTVQEAVRAGTGQPVTVHNCYGLGPTQCQQFWQDSPKQQPLLIPVQRGSIQK